ncbi:MAG: hypothetical protein BWY95_02311 [Bacteroidetes bacterium ADurb.BinA104]|jgi:1-deoxy-D-xylulose 5-phosphate reductoisomerase|nr:MAG: hypothetical protein BWY95_02311 [Bacteroidetes bacterium ADurb.BinA104]
MVEILKIEKVLTEKEDVSDFVKITFRTDLGNIQTTRYPIQDVSDEAKMKQFVYEKAKFFDTKDSFSPINETIVISEEDVKPEEPVQTDEQKFLNAVPELEQWKRYLEMGLITDSQYSSKLNEVKKLIPSGYFDIGLTKE